MGASRPQPGTDRDQNTFQVGLSNPQSGATIVDGTGSATIINNAPVEVSIADATATEGVDATADFVISLSRATTGVVRMAVATDAQYDADGNDYVHKNVIVEILPGETQAFFLCRLSTMAWRTAASVSQSGSP